MARGGAFAIDSYENEPSSLRFTGFRFLIIGEGRERRWLAANAILLLQRDGQLHARIGEHARRAACQRSWNVSTQTAHLRGQSLHDVFAVLFGKSRLASTSTTS